MHRRRVNRFAPTYFGWPPALLDNLADLNLPVAVCRGMRVGLRGPPLGRGGYFMLVHGRERRGRLGPVTAVGQVPHPGGPGSGVLGRRRGRCGAFAGRRRE